MFSQTAEYALRAAVHIAANCEERQTSRDIAEAMDIPVDYLAKVMQSLVRAGLVHGFRGKTGGFCLVKAASETSVLDIVNAVDPIRRIRSCPLRLAQHREQLCPLHRKMDEAVASVEHAFRTTTLADLIETPASNTLAAFAIHGQ